MRITLDSALQDRVKAAWILLEDVHHREDPGFREAVAAACDEIQGRWSGSLPSEIPALAPARELYRAVGMEPTRHRPSSEALMRRVLQGKGLYRLDPVVDTGNLFSLTRSLPLGLYDRDRIVGDVALRLGEEGESFAGIRKGPVNVGGRLCLADDEGAFGSPTSDSHRCRIREDSCRVLTLLYAPLTFESERLRREAGELAASFVRWNGARVEREGWLGSEA